MTDGGGRGVSSPQPAELPSAAVLEFAPKLVARIQFNPLKKQFREAPTNAKRPLDLTVVRFDLPNVQVSGLSHWVCDGCASVAYATIDIPTELSDGSAKSRNRTCYWGYTSSGRFGMVVPSRVVEAGHGSSDLSHAAATNAGSAGNMISAWFPRSVTLLPPGPDADWFSVGVSHDQSSKSGSVTPRASSTGILPGGGASFFGGGLREALGNHSFARGLEAVGGAEGSAATALLGNLGGTAADLFEAADGDRKVTLVGGESNGGQRGGENIIQRITQPRVVSIEEAVGEGSLHSMGVQNSLLQFGTEWLLSRLPRHQDGHAHQHAAGGAFRSTVLSGGSSSQEPSPFSWSNADEMLPHFFNQRPSVSAAAYATAMGKYCAKLSYDKSQLVALIGDSKGLFLVTPLREAASYIEAGLSPQWVDGPVASLGRGSFDFAMNGHVFHSVAETSEAFEADLPIRLRLPSDKHTLRSITNVAVDIGEGEKEQNSIISRTTITEKLFLRHDVTPQTLANINDDELWTDTVVAVRKLPSSASWCEAVEMSTTPFGAVAGHGGQRRGTLRRATVSLPK